MPIRFRCAYCNQLMGIARRKAGTVVRCPTCSGQVVVPNPTGNEADEPEPNKPAPNLFERSDIDDLLRPEASPAATVASGAEPASPPPRPPTGAWGTGPEPAMGVERLDKVAVAAPAPPGMLTPLPASAPGVVLTPGKMTFLAVVGVLLLGIAFAAGVVVGKYVLGP